MTSCVFPGYSFVGGFQAEGKFFILAGAGQPTSIVAKIKSNLLYSNFLERF